MTFQDITKVVCPESTIESANRRNFIKGAALTTAAAGIASSLLGSKILPESSATSDSRVTGCCSAANGYGVEGISTGSSGWGVFGWAKACGGTGVHGTASCGATIGVLGYTNAPSGIGVCGFVSGVDAVGIRGSTCLNQCAIPIVALGNSCQKAHLQRWMKGCTIKSVVNSCGWFGIGTSSPSSRLDVVGNVTVTCNKNCACLPGLGILGKATGVCACGIVGCATGPGDSYGVRGVSSSPCGIGVYGCGARGVVGSSGSGSACAIAVHGIIVSTSPGSLSAAVRGTNDGTGDQGVGVYGEQKGSGWGVYGHTPKGCGVVGNSCCGAGVYGSSCKGPGVLATSVASCGLSALGAVGALAIGGKVGVEGAAGNACAIPFVARGAPKQKANLQQWENSCGTVYAVINAAGSLGLGGVTKPNHVLCISGKAHASSGFGIGPCNGINTTLAVNGSIAAKIRSVSSTSTLATTDYAILASGAITLTLPPASTQSGMMIFIKNVSTSTVSVVPGGTDSIEGATSASPKTLSKQYDSLMLISNGTSEWFLLGNSLGDAFVS